MMNNLSELHKRVIVAVILIPVALFITFWENTIPFSLAVYALIIVGNRELYKMYQNCGVAVPKISILGSILIPLSIYYGYSRGNPWGYFAIALALIILATFVGKMATEAPTEGVFGYVSSTLFAAVFFPFIFSFVWLIRMFDMGAWWLLFLFIAIWTSDSCAYFVGRKFGKHKIVPKISPKKSLEGFIGGFVCGTAGAMIYFVLVLHKHTEISPLYAFLMAATVVIVGIFGDLFESMLKRDAGVKDSGALLPGHGGALDRFDSLMFAAPVLYAFLWIAFQ